jgi:hypothetical protein
VKAEEKLAAALKRIAEYIEGKQPKTLEEAKHMLALIGVMATESLWEMEAT